VIDVSEVFTASSICLIMEEVSSSETSVNFCEITWHNIPEECHFHTLYENFKSKIKTRSTTN
jgi:hypothetical protein